MTDESPVSTKTDVLDLVISFLMEHEKEMDKTVQRLEKIVDIINRKRPNIDATTTQHVLRDAPNHFSLIINAPHGFERIRSLNIEWGTDRRDKVHEKNDQESIIKMKTSTDVENVQYSEESEPIQMLSDRGSKPRGV